LANKIYMTNDWQRPKYQEIQEYILRNGLDDYEKAEEELTYIRNLNKSILNYIANIIKNSLVLWFRKRVIEKKE